MNAQFFVKVAVSALIIALVSEISKRNNTAGTLLASLPLTTLLALVWLWHETHDAARLATWTTDVVWLVVPSLPALLLLGALLRRQWSFYGALATASAACALGYLLVLQLQKKL
jgi:hypothetical protein